MNYDKSQRDFFKILKWIFIFLCRKHARNIFDTFTTQFARFFFYFRHGYLRFCIYKGLTVTLQQPGSTFISKSRIYLLRESKSLLFLTDFRTSSFLYEKGPFMDDNRGINKKFDLPSPAIRIPPASYSSSDEEAVPVASPRSSRRCSWASSGWTFWNSFFRSDLCDKFDDSKLHYDGQIKGWQNFFFGSNDVVPRPIFPG